MSRINPRFETVFEKIARIMTRSFGINVTIEGNAAYTDGKKIVLPMLEDVTDELRSDMNGFLDHEVAHCKFTNFEAGKAWKNRFHRELSNAIEDSRIERLLPREYPGCAISLERLNEKWQSRLDEKRDSMPWPIRFILSVRDVYDGKGIRKDEQIEPLIASALPEIKALQSVKSTDDVVSQTAEIIRLINLAREKMFKGLPPADDAAFDELDEMRGGETPLALDPNRNERQTKEAKGIEQLDPATEYKKNRTQNESESQDEKSDESDESDLKSENSESKSKEADNKSDNKSEKKNKASISAERKGNKDGGRKDEEAKSGRDSESKKSEAKNYEDWKETEIETQMLKDSVKGKSEFDKHEFNTESYMDTQFEEAVSKEPEVQKLQRHYDSLTYEINPKYVSLPYTRKYDKVTDYSGRGDRDKYAERKRKIMKFVNPIKQHLERVLLVKENKKMIPERERGLLNNRTLATLCIDKNYRTPFRQFSKTDTTNVAVSLVIDCSGSMRNDDLIEIARQTGLALGESLKSLGITFEIVGFNTITSSEMIKETKNLPKAYTTRFNRLGEALNHMIFKGFDSNDLSGICNAEAGGCNADGESLTWAAKRLAERKEKRKIMIVLSDGQPSYVGANHKILAGDLKRVVNLITKTKIEILGIGICTDDVKLFYDDYIVVNDISKLASTTVGKLAKKLEEGYK